MTTVQAPTARRAIELRLAEVNAQAKRCQHHIDSAPWRELHKTLDVLLTRWQAADG